MNVQAINGISSTLQFEGSKKNKQPNVKKDYPQMDAPSSKAVAKAFRTLALAGILTTGAVSMSSCADADADAAAYAGDVNNYNYIYLLKCGGCGNGCDIKRDTTYITVHDTITNEIRKDSIISEFYPVYLKEYPYNIGDSLIAQGQNIGVELDGPDPKNNENVIFIGSKAHNRYDNKFYETKLDSIETNAQTLSLTTKSIDLYDEENPKVTWLKTRVNDIPGKGIKLTRFTCEGNSDKEPAIYDYNYAGYEIRTNLRNGKNRVLVYDNNNNFVKEMEYKKDEDNGIGSFLCGSMIYNDDGTPYIDKETGEIEYTNYKFDQAKMYSSEVEFVKFDADTAPQWVWDKK